MLKRYRDILYEDALRRRLASGGGPFTVTNADVGLDYTITTSGGRTYYNFIATGKTMTITNMASVTVDYVAIGGGGGGGADSAGGGGAGGLQQATSFTLTPDTRTITIGAGGAGGPLTGPRGGPAGGRGGNTTFSTVTALGGGGSYSYLAVTTPATTGGCGAGDSYPSGFVRTGTQGGNGGTGIGGGGGGVGGNGVNCNSINGGDGGIGITYNNGTALQLGGGGGGGAFGGAGVVGLGVYGGGNGGRNTNSTAGTPNTGGGGGGGGGGGSSTTGGSAGGSGIFIISYLG